MKILNLILLSLSLLLPASADTVTFTWKHNTEPDLAGYRLYWAAPGGEFENVVVIPAGQNRVDVEMPPESQAFLVAVNATGEKSDPTFTLIYHPAIVELVLQQSRDPSGFFEVYRWELFRMPSELFNPAMLEIEQRLNITQGRVSIQTPLGDFKSGIDMTGGKKFFRSFVAVR